MDQLEEFNSNINEKINEGLVRSDHFMLIWSRNASKSKWVKREYNAAITEDYDKRLKKIILRLDRTMLPPLLADKKYVHVTNKTLEFHIKKIIERINLNRRKVQMKKFSNPNMKIFNDFLDFTYEVDVMGIKYNTSEVLKHIDPDRYLFEFDKWKMRVK